MVRRRLSLRLVAMGLTLGVAALPTPVAASGFQLVEQNASGLGNAFAGQAAGVRDASAIFFNPAALTHTKGWNVLVSVEPIGVSTTFVNTGSTRPQAGPLAFPGALGSEGGNAGKWIPVPNAYVSGQINDRIFAGVGVNVPFGLETDWDPDWMGRFIGTRSKLQALNVNPTVAVKLGEQVSLGVGANWQHLTADLDQQVAYGTLMYAGAAQAIAALPPATQQALLGVLLPQLGPGGLTTEGSALISGDSTAWGWNAGALVELGEEAQLAVSYRSKVKHEIDGDVTFSGAPQLAETGPTAAIGLAINPRFASGPVTAEVELPDTLSIAASWKRDKLELMADWTRTGWSSIQRLDIVRAGGTALNSLELSFEDTWRAGLGANLELNDKWTARVGTAYDKAPVVDEFRSPRLPDNDRVWAAAGFQWRATSKVRVDVGYAHLFIGEASSDAPPTIDGARTLTSGTLVGNYSASVNILGAQVNLGF